MNTKQKNIDFIVNKQLMFLYLFVMAFILVIGFWLSFSQFKEMKEQEIKRLNDISPFIIQSVSNEILADNQLALNYVINDNVIKFNLSKIEIFYNIHTNSKPINRGFSQEVVLLKNIPYKNNYKIKISSLLKVSFLYLFSKVVFFLCIPFLVSGFMLIYMSNKALKSYIINPIKKMAKYPSISLDRSDTAREILLLNRMYIRYIKIFERKRDTIEKLKINENLSKLAAQVAHDIVSPVSVLRILSKNINYILDGDKKIFLNSIERINEISNNLIRQYKNPKIDIDNSDVEHVNIYYELDLILEEKKIQYSNTNISIHLDVASDTYIKFCCINANIFKRVISNLINNAAESIPNIGLIEVKLYSKEKNIIIEICDNGSGVDEEILNRILEYGISYGKQHGSGLGLTHARYYINKWTGKFNLESKAGSGTKVTIQLPSLSNVPYFIRKINLKKYSKIVILDDQVISHQIIKKQLQKYENINVISIYKDIDFLNYIDTHSLDNTLFLMDYDLNNSSFNGIDLIMKYNIQLSSVLVTNNNEKDLIVACNKSQINLIPKKLFGSISIKILLN